jgi:hypothetical protein
MLHHQEASMHFFITFAVVNVMKGLSIILLLYVLVLTTVPCADRPFEGDGHHSGQCGSTSGDDHDHNASLCSPFCVCNCCGNQVVSIAPTIVTDVLSLTGEQVYFYRTDFRSIPPRSIWQPPKIG